MHCPVCNGHRLRINVLLAGSVTCNFAGDSQVQVLETSEFDSLWNRDARCECPDCSWSGLVADAAIDGDEGLEPSPLAEELVRIERDLKSGDCPTQMADSIRLLLDAVRTLQAQVQIASRFENRRTSSSDTAIL